jgi:Holliday junction resolvase RusA-like endonuclease
LFDYNELKKLEIFFLKKHKIKSFLNIKPLSINEAYKGRKFKTDKYDKYIHDCLYILPNVKMPEPPYKLTLIFGFSNIKSDLDNGIKPFQDILQKKYNFNDRDVYKLVAEKQKVKKGGEFIFFSLESFI